MKKNKLFLLIIYLCFSLTSFGQVKLKFKGKKIVLEATDIVNVSAAAPDQNDNAIKGIMRSLMGAENIPKELDVKFDMVDKPVEDGFFVFFIETKEAKVLTIEMYDEEGFEMTAHDVININQGENYKALNVKSLEDGAYFFKLKDEDGKELVREVTIAQKEKKQKHRKQTKKERDDIAIKINVESTRGVQTVGFQGAQISLSKVDIISIKRPSNPKQDDDAIKRIMRSLMGADNIAKQLDVKFHMNDEPVKEGLFVFGIESEIDMLLTIQVFDEEGFEMEVSSSIEIFIGSNYKALNVMELEDGKYFLLLEDEKGRELVREITIAKGD